jgi:MFS family permease
MTQWRTALRHVPSGVWALGFVSLFMDLSSEMIHALLPVYMVTVLGTSTLAVGVIEGIAEGTASVTKVFSGTLSDRLGKRKLLAVLGYGLSALTKPAFPLAPSFDWLIAARFIDRIGKGVRDAPRDALVADLSPPEARGASFGIRQSLDTVGAFLGPLLALLLMLMTGDNFRLVFWIAVAPAFISVAIIAFGVRDPKPAEPRAKTGPIVTRAAMAALGRGYWSIVIVALVFTLARFSEAFLLLRAQSVGLPIALVPAVLVLMNVVYSLTAGPAGVLSDRIGRFAPLTFGFFILVVADLVLGFAGSVLTVAIGVALWGLHMGFTQGLLAAIVADRAPQHLRGTAFGVFNLVSGGATLAASLIAGGLWDLAGPRWTFFMGAMLTGLALLLLPSLGRSLSRAGG